MGMEYLRCARVIAVLALLAAAASCKTTSSSVAVKEPAITWLDLEVTDVGFAEYRVRLEGEIESPDRAVLEVNRYELVENGRVVKQGQVPIKEPITPGNITIFHLYESSPFSAPEALPGPGGRVDRALIAVRGKLVLRRGGRLQELDYAQAKEVLLPRLPSVRVHELDAARYSDKELHVTLRLAVINPNPFPVPLKGVEFVATIAARQIGSGSMGNGETIDPSTTALFEIGLPINAKTYGPDVNQLIHTASFPYKLTGTLKGNSFEAPFELAGNIRLGSSK